MKKHNLVLSIGLLSMLTLVGCGNNTKADDPVEPDVNSTEAAFVSKVVQFQGSEYKTVQSPVTKKVWLDRNIGAARVCQIATDTACYGDYYQWGRYMDGHQNSNSSTSTEQITDINSTMNQEFIIKHGDWTTADTDGLQRTVSWSKQDGTSVCPISFRIPTLSEIKAETSLKFLELPFAGMRGNNNGDLALQDKSGFLWTSTSSTGEMSKYLHYTQQDTQGSGETATSRGVGMPIRCIKDQ